MRRCGVYAVAERFRASLQEGGYSFRSAENRLETHYMEKFTSVPGIAAPLDITNVDTDMIIPKQYLKTIKRPGLGSGLFAEQRYQDDGSENPDFVLNKPAYRNAKILVAGDNF